MDDEDEASIDAELRRLGLELPSVEIDFDDGALPPRTDDTDWEWGE